EAADVGAPVRDARHSGGEPERELRLERGEVVVDVPRPAARAEALHAGGAGAAEQEHAVIRSRRALPRAERRGAEPVVEVMQQPPPPAVELGGRRRSLAAVEPPAADAET